LAHAIASKSYSITARHAGDEVLASLLTDRLTNSDVRIAVNKFLKPSEKRASSKHPELPAIMSALVVSQVESNRLLPSALKPIPYPLNLKP
jgi:hypothetical protein